MRFGCAPYFLTLEAEEMKFACGPYFLSLGPARADSRAAIPGWVPSNVVVVMTRMSDQLGRVLSGRYRLVAPIGAGASAQVFLADDTRLRRRVAVKILHAGLAADEGFLRRFRTEAQAAAALNHPHVLAVYDWGDDDGAIYLVTEYLEGGSLRGILDAGHLLTPSQALVIGLEATRGLDFAHRRGFVHRDIKPANLLFGEDGRLRIADFGLARALAEAAWTEPSGVVVGTARYASPEQARGEPVDGKSDIYSLALVLIESVTGKVPFAADTTIATLMARIETPVEVPAELAGLRPVLSWAGRPAPDDRPDAGEFALGLLAAAEELARPQPLPLAGATPADGEIDDDDKTLIPAVAASAANLVADGEGETPTRVIHRDELVEEVDAADADDGLAGLSRRHRRQVRREERRADRDDRKASAVARGRAGPAGRRRRWPKVLVVVVAVAALLAGGGFAVATLYTPSHDVPAFIGQSEDEALGRADALGWTVERREDRLDGTEPGEVIGQNPVAGTRLQEGRTIELTISLGWTRTNVPPDLVNRPVAEVEVALTTAGLEIGETTERFDEEVAAGSVIALAADGVTPLPAVLPRGTVVDITVSRGPEPRTVPNAPAGATFEQYAALLQQLRLVPGRVDEFHPTIPPNQLIRIAPPPGSEVARDTAVTVVVSKGPAVTVPPVVGLPLAQAIATLQQAGLVITETSGNGAVLQTDPPAGAVVPRGSGIRIFASA